MWTTQRDGEDWKVVDPTGKTRISGESFAICDNIVAYCNGERNVSGECAEVARVLLGKD
jgi:hypothetical protein